MEEVKLSLDDLRLTPEARANIERSQQKTRKPRNTPSTPFIRGPIPKWWIAAAASMPGKSIHLALALWSVHHCARNHVIRLTTKLLSEFHIKPDSAHRALKRLEGAGLLVADRRQGRLATIRLLLDPPNNPPEESNT